jgi:hypothetical protein
VKRKEIREEVIANGAENIASDTGGEARINRWIQQSYREICDHKPWPFLYATKEGAAPLEIADLGHVQAVVDVAARNELEPATLNQLLLGDPTLSSVGAAMYWFLTDGKKVNVLPVSSATFKVHYRKVPAALTDEEEPIFPADYHDLVVDRTRVKTYKATDNFEAAAEILKDYERQLSVMVHALMHPNYDKERRLTRAGLGGDYL